MLQPPTRCDLKSFIESLSPYAFATISLNQKWRDPEAAHSKLKSISKDVALRLDQRYLKSRNVTRRSARDRFNAIAFSEKLAGNPHTHFAFFAPEDASLLERARRRAFLYRNLLTEISSLSEHELLSSFKDYADAEMCCGTSVLRELNRSLTSNVRSVHCAEGLAWYLTKEYNIYDAEFWFLHEFHSSRTPSDWRPVHSQME